MEKTIKVSSIGEFIELLQNFPPETKLRFVDPDTEWDILEWTYSFDEKTDTLSLETMYDGEMIK